MKIDITQTAIDAGVRRNKNYCAISTAIAAVIPAATNIQTTAETIRFTVNGERHVYASPPKVAEYIIAFDDGARLEAFTLELDNPQILPPRPTVARSAIARRRHPATGSRGGRFYGAKMLEVNRETAPA